MNGTWSARIYYAEHNLENVVEKPICRSFSGINSVTFGNQTVGDQIRPRVRRSYVKTSPVTSSIACNGTPRLHSVNQSVTREETYQAQCRPYNNWHYVLGCWINRPSLP